MKTIWAIALLAVAGAAQERTAADVERDLTRMHGELRDAEILERRLIHMRIESDLGLVVEDAKHFELSEAERARSAAEVQAELEESRQDSARLQRLLEELRLEIEQRRERLVQQARSKPAWSPSPPTPELPAQPPEAGALRPPPQGSTSHGEHAAKSPPLPQPRHGAGGHPAGPTPADHGTAAAESAAPPPTGYIKGSRDHSKVGRALFRAGKFDKAIVELTQAVAKEPPALIDLFYLARSLEKQGRLDEADDKFARVEALDSREDETGEPVLGGWASAARTARQHMTWLRDRGDWKPKVPIESIQWKKR